jgi:hypothetical protein
LGFTHLPRCCYDVDVVQAVTQGEMWEHQKDPFESLCHIDRIEAFVLHQKNGRKKYRPGENVEQHHFHEACRRCVEQVGEEVCKGYDGETEKQQDQYYSAEFFTTGPAIFLEY